MKKFQHIEKSQIPAVPGQISLRPSSEAISMKNLHSDEILQLLPDAGCRLTGNCCPDTEHRRLIEELQRNHKLKNK